MQTQNQIENFLFQGKFDEARECLNNGEKFNEQYLKNNFSQITAKIIDAKELDFIEAARLRDILFELQAK